MACAICKQPLDDHQPALRVLGELPLEIVKSVLQHQWHKDVTRIIYAHAEYYHDQSLFGVPPPHDRQLRYIEADIKRHRAKYIMNYLHAVVEVWRKDDVGFTRVTMENEIMLRAKLEEALDYKLPNDLDAVFRRAKPFAWKGAMSWEQSKRYRDEAHSSLDTSGRMFGQAYAQDAMDRRLITVISITIGLFGGQAGDGFAMFIPKTPDTMWCWNQTTEKIQEYHRMTKLDLL